MKIMLVCMSGITTNILGNKLHAYGMQQGYSDIFTACKIGVYSGMLPQMDFVLIAPQAKYSADKLRIDARALDIPCYELSEEDLIYYRVEHIYEAINIHRISASEHKQRERLPVSEFKNILVDAFVDCAPFILLSAVSWIFYHFTEIALFEILHMVSGDIINLYLMFAIGYQYGKRTSTNAISVALIAVGAPLLMLPLSNIENGAGDFLRLNRGYIAAEAFGIKNTLLFVVLALITVLILEFIDTVILKKTLFSNTIVQMIFEAPLKYGFIFLVFLALRIFLESIH